MLRLLRVADTRRLALKLSDLASNTLTSQIVGQTVHHLRVLAAGPEELLPVLAADAEKGFADPDEIKMSMVALVDDLLCEFDAVNPGWSGRRTPSPAS